MTTPIIIITAILMFIALVLLFFYIIIMLGNKGEHRMVNIMMHNPEVQAKDISDFIDTTRLKLELRTRDDDYMFLPDVLRNFEQFRNERHLKKNTLCQH